MEDNICDKNDGTACPMDLISIFGKMDENIAYDLYQCTKCGMLLKYDLKENRTFLKNDNTIIRK
jgi:hypothetical protein